MRLAQNARVRGLIWQVVLGAGVIAAAAWTIHNVIDNLQRAKIASGFGFWNVTAGFDISQTLIAYSITTSTYGRAFFVGLLNTLLIAALGIVLATMIGFVVGIGRLSRNWLVAKVSGAYVELIRNVPLVLHLLFWYNAVLKTLPDLQASAMLPGGALLNNRGLFLPRVSIGEGGSLVLSAIAVGFFLSLLLQLVSQRLRARGGRGFAVWPWAISLIIGLPAAVFFGGGYPVSIEWPQAGRFNIHGGIEVLPEFVALLVGLSLYTAAFIAEVVRAGLMSVPKGQVEAAAALGLRPGQVLKLVVVPQAKRVIVPPLTNQYLNLTKNSSLAVAIGYPDFVQIFTGTVLNNTGQAVEIVAITVAVYLAISMATSFAMNWYGARHALIEH
jgi:general L-amino acid transport system permease protein